MYQKKRHHNSQNSQVATCNNAESRNLGQELSETIRHFISTRQQSTLGENPGTRRAILRGSDNKLTDKHFSPKQRSYTVAKQTGWKRKGKQRDRVSFVITCREWKSLFEVKENKKKEELVKMEKK